MKTIKKLRAGALQFVLFIGAVIAVLLLTFVLLAHSHLFFAKKTTKFIEVVEKNNLILDYGLSTSDTNSSNIPVSLLNGITGAAEKSYWGLFEKYQTATSFKKNEFKTVALVGGSIDEEWPALFLKDNQRPLVIVSSAKITGTAFLPEQGIRPGNISGESYYANRLVYGAMKKSRPALPKLDAQITTNITSLCNQAVTNTNTRIVLSRNTILKQSFLGPTQFVFGDFIDLSGITLVGNIQVIASQSIRVDASTQLADVILSAPKITVGDGFVGSFQAFASKQITIGSNTTLEYPSALVVKSKNQFIKKNSNTLMPPSISVKNGSVVKGFIIFKDDSEERQFFPQLKIESGTNIIGQVYCEKSMELKGNIIGSVYTDGFMALENGNIYQNHLYKGTINAQALQEQFVGMLLTDIESNKKVAKWLY